ncbi:MAG TPA: hypothetical protein VJ506_02315 [Candidatus Limnocylindrales bacterium]|nr:hypothetical protein [Candidatus Limnocylindrales bacterium]
MILRVVAGVTGGTRPPLERGLVRAHLGTDRATGELVEVTVWDDTESARSAGGDGHSAEYFDIGTTWLEWSREEPVVFRVAVGRFTRPGSDREMLAALRDRIPELGDGMTESAAGRRLNGRAVEVLFFSAWAREPAGRRVDRAFWRDLSLHDDGFVVRVCSPVQPIVSRRPGP